jgi:hypothetical protein
MDAERALERVADQYREEGYAVLLRPTGDALPHFLSDCAPDLIAQQDGENVVVQVRVKQELGGDEELNRLAGLVNGEPGWRLDLVVLDPWPDEVPRPPVEPDEADILRLTEDASRLLQLSMPGPALVAAWAALEAAMRRTARTHGIALDKNHPRYVAGVLYSEDLLSTAEYDRLLESLPLRNAVVRGLCIDGDVTGHVNLLVDLAKRLAVSEPEPAQP